MSLIHFNIKHTIQKKTSLLLWLLILACNQSNNKPPGNVYDVNQLNAQRKSLLTNYNINLPPVDLLYDLRDVNMSYSPEAVNPHSNHHNYISERSKMLNLGVYLADFSYLSAIGNRSELTGYLNSIKYISDELKITGLFDEQLVSRFRMNLSNSDSLYYLSIETHNKMVEELSSTNRQNTLLHISIGGFIESFYLYTEPIESQADFEELCIELHNYHFVFNEYFTQAQKMMSSPFLNETLQQLNELKEVFDKIEQNNSSLKVIKGNDGNIKIEGGNTLKIEYNNLKEIKPTVKNIRNDFITLN